MADHSGRESIGTSREIANPGQRFCSKFGKGAQAALPACGEQDMAIDLELGKQPLSGKL